MPRVRRSSPRSAHPQSGTVLEVCAVCRPSSQGPLGGPALRPVGAAVVNPDRTITAWLAAQPQSGVLLLRPFPHAALLNPWPRPRLEADELATTPLAGQAASHLGLSDPRVK